MVVQDVQCLRAGQFQHCLACRGPHGHVLAPGEIPGLALNQVAPADADSLNQIGLEMLVELEKETQPRELIQALAARGGLESFTRFVPGVENIFIRAVEEDRAHA